MYCYEIKVFSPDGDEMLTFHFLSEKVGLERMESYGLEVFSSKSVRWNTWMYLEDEDE